MGGIRQEWVHVTRRPCARAGGFFAGRNEMTSAATYFYFLAIFIRLTRPLSHHMFQAIHLTKTVSQFLVVSFWLSRFARFPHVVLQCHDLYFCLYPISYLFRNITLNFAMHVLFALEKPTGLVNNYVILYNHHSLPCSTCLHINFVK